MFTRLHYPLACAMLAALACADVAVGAPLPPRFTGTWTAPTSRFGEGKQLSLYFDANGAGMMIGFFAPVSSSKDTRVFYATPMAATLDGDTFVARALPSDPAYAEQVARMVFTCSYDPVGPALACQDPNHVVVILERRSDGMTSDLVEAIETMRSNLPAAHVRMFPPVPAP